jgi:PAS domain S-box-containing protein
MTLLQDITKLSDNIHYQSRLLKFQTAIIEQFTFSELIWYTVSNPRTAHFELVSPAFCLRLGYSHREMCEHNYFDFMHPQSRQKTMVALADLADSDNNKHQSFKNTYLTSAGDAVHLEWMDAIKLKDGNWLTTVKEVPNETN